MDGKASGAVIGSPGKKLTVEMIRNARRAMLESDKRIAMWNDLADMKSKDRVRLDDLEQEARDSFDKFKKGEMLLVTAQESNDMLNLAANALNGFGAYGFIPNPKGLKMENVTAREVSNLVIGTEPSMLDAMNRQQEKWLWGPFPWTPKGASPWILPKGSNAVPADQIQDDPALEAKRVPVDWRGMLKDAMRQQDHHLAVAKDAMAKLACAEANITSLQMEVASLKAQLAALEQPDPPDDDPSTQVHDAIKVMALNNFQLTARAGWHK